MNCEKCQELLSDFLDSALTPEEQATLDAHFGECLSCFSAHDELNSIVSFCRENRADYDAPPNERALWLRIQNTIEADRVRASAASAVAAANSPRENLWTRLINRSWELSFSQMAMAVAAIVIAVSLATAFSLRRMQNDSINSPATASVNGTERQNTAPMMFAATGPNIRSVSQQLDYWQQRVDERKARWSAQRREDFDLNLKVIDQTVEENLRYLKEHPHDEISEEMLNAALSDKVELLREFSDL